MVERMSKNGLWLIFFYIHIPFNMFLNKQSTPMEIIVEVSSSIENY